MFSRVSWSTQVALPWQGRWARPVSPALSGDLPPLQGPFLMAPSIAALSPLLGVPACVCVCANTHTSVIHWSPLRLHQITTRWEAQDNRRALAQLGSQRSETGARSAVLPPWAPGGPGLVTASFQSA